MALVSMEYLSQNDKVRLGKALLPFISVKKDVDWKIWALSKARSKENFFTDRQTRVVSPAEAVIWQKAHETSDS